MVFCNVAFPEIKSVAFDLSNTDLEELDILAALFPCDLIVLSNRII